MRRCEAFRAELRARLSIFISFVPALAFAGYPGAPMPGYPGAPMPGYPGAPGMPMPGCESKNSHR